MPPHIHALAPHNVLGALLSRELPPYTGQYKVGVMDIEVPLDEEQTFGNFRHRRMPDAPAGLSIDTVLFTVFYPADRVPLYTRRAVWFPKMGQTVDGFLRMANKTPSNWWRAVTWPAAWLAVAGTTFAAHPNAPLLPHPKGKKYPVILFSHGVGCSRLMYSTYCGEMASRGYIVVAVEHRDGSGPSSTIVAADGTSKRLDWLSWRDLDWPDLPEQPPDDTTLRQVQLQVRLAELEGVISMLKQMDEGICHCRGADKNGILKFKGRVDATKPIMAGHSFGGTAGIAAAADPRFSFSKLIVSDPACQRLGEWRQRITIPYITVNSEEWTRSKEYEEAEPIFESAKSDRATFSVTGSTHPSYSDVFLIMPTFVNSRIGMKALPQRVIRHYVHVTEAVLDGELDSLREQAQPINAVEDLPSTTHKDAGHLILHLEKDLDS